MIEFTGELRLPEGPGGVPYEPPANPVEHTEFCRDVLADELIDRAPELAHLAEQIRALPLDDPRLIEMVNRGSHEVLDCWDSEEFLRELEPFLDDHATELLARGVTIGPDFTRRWMRKGKAQIVAIASSTVGPKQQPGAN